MIFYTLLLDTEEEKSQLEKLYMEHYKAMFALANDVLKDQMAAEDAVHVVILKVIQKLKLLQTMNQQAQWAYISKLTYTTSIDIYRKRKKDREHLLYDMTEEWYLPKEVQKVFWDMPEENRIITSIQYMPPLYRDVFILKYHFRYNTKEIAAMLGLSESSVRQRISRGKRKLEALLKERGVL